MISDYFTHKITVYRPTRDPWNMQGEARIVYDARVQQTDRAVRSSQGEIKQASYLIYLSSDAVIMPEDQIYLGDGESESGDQFIYPVLSIFHAVGFADSHLQVTV